MYLKRFITFYQKFVVILANNLVIFVLVNIIFLLAFMVKDHYLKELNLADELSLKYNNPSLRIVYPELNASEINKLLTETWTRRYAYEPFTQFKEAPFVGKYVNVDKNGFRLSKNQGPWPPVSDNFNVFLFGSSSIFNYGLPDDQTIASYLQECLSKINLKKNVCIYNFGRGHYFSTQELILFQALLGSGFVPDIAIFIDGLSDFYNTKGTLTFTAELRNFVDAKRNKNTLAKSDLLNIINGLPLFRGIDFIRRVSDNINRDDISQQNKNVVTANTDEDKYNDETIIARVINRYVNNKRVIEAIASVYSVNTVFVWQPVPMYKYDLKYHLFAPANGFWSGHTFSKYGYPRMAEFVKKQPLGNNFLWCADMQEDLKEPLYVDIAHYTAGMSKRLAYTICDLLLKRGLLVAENK
jgi:hypothetical protein